MQDFIAQFHPLLVHLPIGFLLLTAMLFLAQSRKWLPTDPKTYLWAHILTLSSSVFTILSGLLLENGGGYPADLIAKHKFAGFVLFLLVAIMVMQLWFKKALKYHPIILIASIISLSTTGHWGGSLTHGEDYLQLLPEKAYEKPTVTNPDSAMLYSEIVEPILAEKCWSCHSSKKVKGGLRMDSPEKLFAGGEHGKVVLANKAGSSEMYERLLLPKENDKHMPPDGRDQLSKQEIKVIEWWINSGAGLDKRVFELNPNSEIKGVLAQMFQKEPSKIELPSEKLESVDPNIIQDWYLKGITITPMQEGNPYVAVHVFTTKPDWKLLEKIAPNIIQFKASKIVLDSLALNTIASFKNVQVLECRSCSKKASFSVWNKLAVKRINLSQTILNQTDITEIAGIKSLEKLYIFESGIEKNKFSPALAQDSRIVFGGYEVPTLATDTTFLTE